MYLYKIYVVSKFDILMYHPGIQTVIGLSPLQLFLGQRDAITLISMIVNIAYCQAFFFDSS